MTDPEKVIQGLECHQIKGDGLYSCETCPYITPTDACADVLNSDALALLKAQEPRTVVNKHIFNEIYVRARCPWCDMSIDEHYDSYYCGVCGKPVKWDG